MKTFNIISYEGRRAGTVKAANYETAFNNCLDKNINVYDDYFLEEEATTRSHDAKPGRTIYTEEYI